VTTSNVLSYSVSENQTDQREEKSEFYSNTAHLLENLQLQHFTQERLHTGRTGFNESIRVECDFLTLMELQSISVSSNQLD
jgi:hypothetical protein